MKARSATNTLFIARTNAPVHWSTPGLYRELSCLLFMFCVMWFAGILLSLPAGADTVSSAPARDAIVGNWEWFDGAGITMHEDGTFTGRTAKGNVSGKWKLMDAAKNEYKLLWRVNDEVAGMDTVVLAADAQSLGGQSSDGKAVSGKRKINATSPPPEDQTGNNQQTGTTQTGTTQTGTTGTNNSTAGSRETPGLGMLDFRLHLGTVNGKLIIASVANNPLAAIMKLKNGDRVLSIDGQKTDGMTLEKAEQLMRGRDGKAAQLEILRQADNTRVTFSMPQFATVPGRTTTTTQQNPSGNTSTTASSGGETTTTVRVFENFDDGGIIEIEPEGGEAETPEATAEARARAANRKKAQEHIMQGAVYQEDGKWQQAEAEYRKGLQLDPTRDDAWTGLGEVYSAQKKWDDAVAAYRKALDMWPDIGLSHADLARALLRQGKRDEALKEAREALRLGEEHHPVYKELGLK